MAYIRDLTVNKHTACWLSVDIFVEVYVLAMWILNSLRLSDAYMHQQTGPWLVQIMACRLLSTKPLSESVPAYCQLELYFRNKFQWNYNQNSNIFIQENAFENVICKMAAILPQPQAAKQVLKATFIKIHYKFLDLGESNWALGLNFTRTP